MGLHFLWFELIYFIDNQIVKYILSSKSGFECKPTFCINMVSSILIHRWHNTSLFDSLTSDDYACSLKLHIADW